MSKWNPTDIAKIETDQKKIKTYIVALTERYEVEVSAVSKEDAIGHVTKHGFAGSSPKWSKVTARTLKR